MNAKESKIRMSRFIMPARWKITFRSGAGLHRAKRPWRLCIFRAVVSTIM